MIVKNYDIGWGQNWPMKQLEQQIVDRVVAQYQHDHSRTVIINTVWYSGEYHETVMQELRDIQPTRIVVVAMLDPPNFGLDRFGELGCEVVGVGYYPGQIEIDYFALFMHQFYQSVDTAVLLNFDLIDTAYMCLNRKPHLHRTRLYKWLEATGLLDHGFVSMGGTPPIRTLENDSVSGTDLAPNGSSSHYGIGNDIASLGNIDRWCRHFVNIVTETAWEIESSRFLSEKTFKSILGCRPFLIHTPGGGVNSLTTRGFEPYVDDFNDITDLNLSNPNNHVQFLTALCGQPKSYWQMKCRSLEQKLVYNQQRFYNHVREQQTKF